jgi:SAM-dependent methyltransferase
MNDMYVYDSAFQNMTATGSAYAASRIISIVQTIMLVQSVVDIGCARGTWLRQWQAQGVNDVIGVDGGYVDRDKLEIAARCFVVHDLATHYDLRRRFDLAQSLEVAEHLAPTRAASFVADIVALAPAVLFSAAAPGQGGENHLNEQPHSYWRALFRNHGYVAIDCFRPLLAKDAEIPRWYRYNLILYVRRDELQTITPFARMFQLSDQEPITDTSPFAYKLRKALVRTMPRSACDLLARWNARRFGVG